MRQIFNILQTSIPDKLAYITACAGAACWFIEARFPAVIPGQLKETLPVYLTLAAALAGGILIAKYVFREGYWRSLQEVNVEKETLAVDISNLKKTIQEIKAQRDEVLERESALKSKLKNLENSLPEAELSSLRKKIRLDEEGRRTSLSFLVYELKNNLQELDDISDPDIARAAGVLKKEIQLLENEIKKGVMPLYELVLKANGIREDIYDLMLIRLQSIGGKEGAKEEIFRERRQDRYSSWFEAETDPSRIDRIYKFLKVAFHPDRFYSDGLKKEAKIHFQEAMQAYSSLKEKIRTTH